MAVWLSTGTAVSLGEHMSVLSRYNRVLATVNPVLLSKARERRLASRLLYEGMRLAADAADIPAPVEEQLTLSQDLVHSLLDLGYSEEEISRFSPSDAQSIVDSGLTKSELDSRNKKTEKMLDEREERVLTELERAKHKLELLKHKLTKTETAKDKVTDQLEKLSGDQTDLAKRRADMLERHLHQWERLIQQIHREIDMQEKLILALSQSDDKLIKELQDIKDATEQTPGVTDDLVIQEIIQKKNEELSEIVKLRTEYEQNQREIDQLQHRLRRLLHEESKLLSPGAAWTKEQLHTLRDSVNDVEADLEEASHNQKSLMLDILRHEEALRDNQTERKLHDLKEALREIPEDVSDMSKLQEKSKEEIAPEADAATSLEEKPRSYKLKAQEMASLKDQLEMRLGDFVVHYLGPDIPNDKTVDGAILKANARIVELSKRFYKLAERYARNDMYRSAIALPGVLYEIVAVNMSSYIEGPSEEAAADDSSDDDDAELHEAHAIVAALVEAGQLREAISLRELLEKGKQKAEQGKQWLEKKMAPEHQRRDFGKQRDESRKALDSLGVVERQLQEKRRQLQAWIAELKAGDKPDPIALRKLENELTEVENQLRTVGERRDVMQKGLAQQPAPGVMRGLEQGSRRKKNDQEQAKNLIKEFQPQLVRLLALVPDDKDLEKELLLVSSQIRATSNKLRQFGEGIKKKYPGLPTTLHAYGSLFDAVDEALHRGLTTNEGLSSKDSQAA